MSISVRPAIAADAPALCEVNIRSIREICAKDYEAERVATWLSNKVPENFLKWMGDPKLRLYTGLIEERIAGVCLLDVNGFVFLLYVVPEALGTGLGKAMLGRMQDDARGLGLERLQLKSTVTARVFYERQGFTNLGPSDDVMPSFHMEKRIAAETSSKAV